MSFFDARRELVVAGARLHQRGLVAGRQGNLSLRLREGIAITAAGRNKGKLQPADIVLLDPADGRVLRGSAPASSESALHLAVYRARPDLRAVAHAHPPQATGFAAAGLGLENGILPEVEAELGGCPLAPFGRPGGEELADSIRGLILSHDVLLLANHGALAASAESLDHAVDRMEQLESAAQTLLAARLLGGGKRPGNW